MLKDKLEGIKTRIISLETVVQTMLKNSQTAVYERDHITANNIITNLEQLVNRMETENEQLFIEFLALYQPEASDLRTVVSLLKINNTLERIADHTVNIAQRMPSFTSIRAYRTLDIMFETAKRMFRESFDAMASRDARLLKETIARDALIDKSLRKLTNEVLASMDKCMMVSNNAISALLIGRDLERIADLTTNICEDMIYMLKGDMIKHRHHDPVTMESQEAL
jgi:phosphate transport system protein